MQTLVAAPGIYAKFSTLNLYTHKHTYMHTYIHTYIHTGTVCKLAVSRESSTQKDPIKFSVVLKRFSSLGDSNPARPLPKKPEYLVGASLGLADVVQKVEENVLERHERRNRVKGEFAERLKKVCMHVCMYVCFLDIE